ncbi:MULTISPECIES: MFS transporter [unclassified Pseudomonas]|uniref:MFS transporter n=1 Tax=unclassified Pseudomonas TaxID=196821 RepID=UPI000BC60DD0|nr:MULTISPECIES: MFS transporter [unclassified Pseudomonas]PVZ19867.1 putative MFS transporter [Pseudomonas sp. URIL14HWK12:I12]PVZ26933.1 putative MFS transporter [Pseudomonas sp. URIL14HWK12:I10]PVZ37822.1 putative MFS transporter [Pseudomonas sp. URIL14HWK12:I11]SNZ05529.1 MFS transporter, putative metabolite:H+ symporter [Pseudomonas sp. URIL14HWK12:I9]
MSLLPQARVAALSARIDRLPATGSLWRLVALLSIGGFFELYDLFQTAYISPGLLKAGIFATGAQGAFGVSDQAAFASATFLGLFVGASLLSPFADRFGRRAVFTYALIWYTLATVLMGVQSSAMAIILCRFIVGIGLGIELVTIDTYLSELMPKRMRTSAFAFAFFVQFLSVPAVALMSWWLVPQAPLGIDGWRWVVLASAVFALFIWWLRKRLPESPRWLAQQGRFEEAEAVVVRLEQRCEQELRQPLQAPEIEQAEFEPKGRFADIWKPPYRRRAFMLIAFNFFQAIGFFGFGNWLPALLAGKGMEATHSLGYAFIITLAYPLGPLLFTRWANRFENKWQIVGSAIGTVIFGTLFAAQSTPTGLIACGVMVTFCNAWLTFAYHSYQSELFPTSIRARAVGFCYSFSRLSTVFSSLMIGFFLEHFGTPGVLAFIVSSMLIVTLTIGGFGPRTRNLALERIAH